MAESTLIQEVKKALRITTTMFDDEISAEIDACLLDMRGAGVDIEHENSALVNQAVKFFCRAYFSTVADSDWSVQYEKLRNAMAARGVQNYE